MEGNYTQASVASSIGTTQASVASDAQGSPLLATIGVVVTPTTTDSASAPTVSKRNNQSACWDHFTRLTNQDGTPSTKPRAKCNYCPVEYFVHTKGNGTSSMRNHMLYACVKCPLYIPNKKQKQISFESAEKGGNMISWAFDKNASRVACARMLVRDKMPFSLVESPGFIDFMKIVQPEFHPPSRRTITRDVWDLYFAKHSRIKNILATFGQRVSLTTNTWTSIQNINYMVLTAHFIDDDWVLHKRILNFVVIPNYKGKTIGQLIETCLLKWGIEKVFCIVVDNASSNKVALDYIKEKIENWRELVLDGEFLQMRCNCHVLNLIVRDGMDELDSSIEAIRNSIKYIRSSPARLERFRKCVVQEKIETKGIVPLDVCTRWNSTYFMLNMALKYRKAVKRMVEEDSQFVSYFEEIVGGKKRVGPPVVDDWEKAARLVKFLKIFYDATLSFSSTANVTANQPLLWMSTILGEIEKCIKSDDTLLAAIGSSMKKKFDKYWLHIGELNKVLLLAVVLDPMYKILYLEYCFPKLQQDATKVVDMISDIKSTLMIMFAEYSKNDSDAAQASYEATMPKVGGSAHLSEEDSHAANMQEFLKLRQAKDVVEIKNEVDKYLLDALEDPGNARFDLLHWWKLNASKFPILSQIARDVFAVPASTVASESAFSLGKRVIDPFRSSLTPKMVESLVCSSDWMRASAKPLFREPSRVEIDDYAEMENVEFQLDQVGSGASEINICENE